MGKSRSGSLASAGTDEKDPPSGKTARGERRKVNQHLIIADTKPAKFLAGFFVCLSFLYSWERDFVIPAAKDSLFTCHSEKRMG